MQQSIDRRVSFVCKRQTSEAATETAQGVLRFVLSTETPDLAGDIVVQSGLVPAYEPLPAMIDHGNEMHKLVGTWHDLARADGKTSARLELLPQGVSRSADLVRAIHKAGVRLGASVKFVPDEFEEIEAKGQARKNGPPRYRFKTARLLEASIVPMPCNAEALQEVGKGLASDQRATWDQLIRVEVSRHTETYAKAVAAVKRINALLST